MLKSGDALAAVTAFHEGVACLKPLFLCLTKVFRPLMAALVVDYLRACKTAGADVDMDLLHAILPRLSDDETDAAEA